MASIMKRGSKWRVSICVKGSRRSKTFRTKAEAATWALQAESETGLLSGKQTFGDLLKRYAKEVSPKKRGHYWESRRIELIQNDVIASVRLSDLGRSHIAEWRDRRLQKVSAGTVLREWNLLSHACTVAVREWQWLKTNPMSTVSRPPEPKPRTRRPSEDEIDRLILASGYDYDHRPETIAARCGACFLFAIETAMRAGEICGLEWEHVHDNYVHLPMTKNGSSRDVPLTKEAQRIIQQMKGTDDSRVFGISSSQLESNFRLARKRAAIEGLTFHDSRREALTRLSKKLDVLELARVSGHRDLKILLQVYYAPTVGDLAEKLD